MEILNFTHFHCFRTLHESTAYNEAVGYCFTLVELTSRLRAMYIQGERKVLVNAILFLTRYASGLESQFSGVAASTGSEHVSAGNLNIRFTIHRYARKPTETWCIFTYELCSLTSTAQSGGNWCRRTENPELLLGWLACLFEFSAKTFTGIILIVLNVVASR